MGRRDQAAAWLAIVLVLAAGGAGAQQVLPLPGGFSPDPWLAQVDAQADRPARDWVRGCPGQVGDVAALRIVLTEPVAPLRLVQMGDGLSGLVVSGPDGIYRCAAAGPSGRTTLVLEPPLEGHWDVFPALAAQGEATGVRLLISERDLDEAELFRLSGIDSGPLRPSATPAFGRHAMPGGGPLTLAVTAAGSAPAGAVADPTCAGWIEPSRPDLVLSLDVAEPVLSFRATGGADLTLVIVDPQGRVTCNDDAFGTDPAIGFEPAESGDWAMWVGTFSSDGHETAVVTVDRVSLDADQRRPPQDLDLDAAPAGGAVVLSTSGQSVDLSIDPVSAATGVDPSCAGDIDPSRPDVAISVAEGSPALWLRVAAEADSTLMVIGPDGAVHCVDDGYGVDPVLRFDLPEAGTWLVWVGLWTAAGPEPATLLLGPDAASVDLPDGFEPGSPTEPAGSPFLGRDIPDALTALDILLEDPSAAGTVRYDRREALGPEGFRLHGLVLQGPEDSVPPLHITELTVEDLDLAGLAATGAPGRFRLEVSGLRYGDVATAVADTQGLNLPDIDPEATLALELALMPPDRDLTRRDLTIGLDIAGEIGLRVTARMEWPDIMGLPENTGTVPMDALTLEIENRGYVARMIAGQAADLGMMPEAFVAMILDSLRNVLAPVTPGSPAEQLMNAAERMLDAPEVPGILRLEAAADTPLSLEALLDTLGRPDPAAARAAGVTIRAGYENLR